MFNSVISASLTFSAFLICLLSGGIAFLASREYNRGEDQVAHFRIEKLRARRRR